MKKRRMSVKPYKGVKRQSSKRYYRGGTVL